MSVNSHGSFPPPTPSARSNFTTRSTERDFDSDLTQDLAPDSAFDLDGTGNAINEEDAVHFCLLAEFDIDAGATLAHQYPYPTGTDEHRLAELMLPDGAHLRAEDWTIFYLGQTPSSAVAPMLSHESSTSISTESSATTENNRNSVMPLDRATRGVAGSGGGLLYVLNCVRMKEDKKMRRGAMVKAMAICTPNPYIGIYKPLLLLALEEYFLSPSPEILARLFDSANAISTVGMPRFTRYERILLRSSERKDLFEEKFGITQPDSGTKEIFEDLSSEPGHGSNSVDDHEGVRPRNGSGSVSGGPSTTTAAMSSKSNHRKTLSSSSGVRMVRKGSASSQTQSPFHLATPPSKEGRLTPDIDQGRRKGVPRDTHFFETEARFKKITVPIRIPMTVFDEDVGDYSLIELVQTFSHNITPFPPPYHPHLHTNGSMTHPIILILNAMLAHKRVMFLGHGLPANQVARMVLAACALGSGCGQVLRGVTSCAFPYANLASLDILEEFSGFVAGVTNPRFEELPTTWDVLCNLETGKITVSKNLQPSTLSNPSAGGSGVTGGTVNSSNVGSMRSGRSSETSLAGSSMIKVEDDPSTTSGTPQAKMNSIAKSDCIDNQFMDEILSAMASHYGESNIRLRFIDYLNRFVRIASHQEYSQAGSTKIGYPSISFRDQHPTVLGSGVVFADEQGKQREMWANAHRVEAWRKTRSYKLFAKDWQSRLKRRSIGFDVQHQIARLRLAKNMSDAEAEAIFLALNNGIRNYDQVIELLTHLPAHWGGLMPIANGLFHRWVGVRENALELLITLQQYPVGKHAVSSMNYFHRKSFMSLLEKREQMIRRQRDQEVERVRQQEEEFLRQHRQQEQQRHKEDPNGWTTSNNTRITGDADTDARFEYGNENEDDDAKDYERSPDGTVLADRKDITPQRGVNLDPHSTAEMASQQTQTQM
ncbi:uncharacterized protein I303_105203 [Kwoniella dejecticola CBS 10117]|uniref:UDENN domain-containing protein n=1 Tax=Kwoniella dejecticola CBS 10117 TaxID=1296121 RepID=A0A1A6A357_9TREE|nr:uncharacterized protein I303_05350 [Kwoniella dejecticola CBS 10117]OBR84492.1 hypothetical protein I303_05350 [Kwoniella dejecticola CBS 10117]